MRSWRFGARLAFGAGLAALSVAGLYAAARLHATLVLPPSTDLLLERIPLVDVSWLLRWPFYGFTAAAIFVSWRFERERLPYLLALFGFWYLIRDVFIALTPVASPADMLAIFQPQDGPAGLIAAHELFFSGHTGIPFFCFLTAKKPGWARPVYLGVSLLMAVAVLLTRNHYAIDVLAAYPMTYAITVLGGRVLEGLDRAV